MVSVPPTPEMTEGDRRKKPEPPLSEERLALLRLPRGQYNPRASCAIFFVLTASPQVALQRQRVPLP